MVASRRHIMSPPHSSPDGRSSSQKNKKIIIKFPLYRLAVLSIIIQHHIRVSATILDSHMSKKHTTGTPLWPHPSRWKARRLV